MRRAPEEFPLGNQELTDIILGQMAAVLRPRRFRKDGVRFFAERADTTLVVELQSSLTSQPDSADVTVNLGVFSHPLAERLGEPPMTDPRPSFCHWQDRLGCLIPAGDDIWWQASDAIAALAAGAEIAALLRLHGLPALERVDSTAKLRARWAAGDDSGLVTDVMRRRYLAALGG